MPDPESTNAQERSKDCQRIALPSCAAQPFSPFFEFGCSACIRLGFCQKLHVQTQSRCATYTTNSSWQPTSVPNSYLCDLTTSVKTYSPHTRVTVTSSTLPKSSSLPSKLHSSFFREHNPHYEGSQVQQSTKRRRLFEDDDRRPTGLPRWYRPSSTERDYQSQLKYRRWCRFKRFRSKWLRFKWLRFKWLRFKRARRKWGKCI
ncbi:hypothetical protein B0O80DRAFT_486663 [Mortierella sp. GBAus27b]|nr:hypothetical protein B0O80DRAFT_486663 [Mortierella sp. GBAus27b]